MSTDKRIISMIPINVSVGFLYWLNETYNLRGLKTEEGTIPITEYATKLNALILEYNEKYPHGLTGWS